MNGLFTTALEVACRAHKKQYDKQGKPYILHVLRVAHSLETTDEELMAIAVLHDTVEDGHETYASLERAGMTPRVIAGVRGLTHNPGIEYLDYVRAMRGNLDCLLVKRADLRDNSNITRLVGVTEKDLSRLNKYALSYTLVNEMIKEILYRGEDATSWQIICEQEAKAKVIARGQDAIQEMNNDKD